MKKFLSLVLAMIMTMSLVTISAGATEYKDLSDKDEIQYEEAVAVLNRIGVITGYEDGTFRPETELTRGAAAKIIVSLMIGPDAANALPNTSSPYSDVPASHTFAGVISYCKTAGYISGYSDGTFKPAGTLTGYAFAKMLLGALGYKSDIEGFTGYGWTNNVARVGNLAQLFDRISFDGAAAVNRDQACQLALNTLKATMVEYSKSTVSGPNGSYTVEGQAQPRTSNNRDINANIGRKDWYGGNNQGSDYLTLEFGEEHFKDLRLEHDRFDPAHDQFGRPSNEWSYKKVTIGTFPLAADFTYTTQVAHIEETDGAKEKALGLRNYDLIADGGYSIWNGWGNTGTVTAINGGTTTLWLNGLEDADYFDAVDNNGKYTHKVADIANFTDNGTLVEVYVSDIDADWITDVVVIQTQLMTVKKIGSDYVSLERYDSPDALKNASPRGTANIGFNLAPIEVNIEQVKDNNEDCYNILKGMKADDYVAVVPVTTDNGKTYEAAEVYVPETVSGALTRVDTYGIGTDADKERGAVSITVGGTAYKLADWNDKMWELKTEDIKATRKDVTLVMDKYGNAFLAKDVGATNDFMVIGNFYQALAGNKICTFVHGWDISGNEVDLNLGSSIKVKTHGNTQSVDNHVLGELVYYTSDGANGDADYVLRHVSAKGDKLVRDVYTNLERSNNNNKVEDAKADYEIKASNLLIPVVTTLTDAEIKAGKADTDNTFGESVADYGRTNTQADGNGLATHDTTYADTNYIDRYYDKGVKFIYVNYVAGDDEVESVEFKSGVQNVSQDELRQAIMNWPAQVAVKDDQVKAVVIKRESNDANINRMLYVTKTLGFKEYDSSTNESFYEVEVAMFTSDGKFVTEQHIIVNKDLQIGDFATYTKVAGTKYEDNYYRVKEFVRHNTNPAALRVEKVSTVMSTVDGKMVKHLMELGAKETYNLYNGKQLVGDIGDDGSDAVMYEESYVLGGYRGSSTTVPNTVEKANGIIRADKAEWLNATRDSTWDDIDSVEDLFDRIINHGRVNDIDVTKAKQTLDNVTLKILLNEKPDSDGFRSAYLIVIADVDGEDAPVVNDPLNTGYALYDAYTTTYDRSMVKGDKFSVTVKDGYKLDLANVKGAIMIDHNVDESYWTFERTTGTVIIPLIKEVGPTPDTYTATLTVDGEKVEEKTGLKTGDKHVFEYTVPEGKVATVDADGKTYNAGEVIEITVTIGNADVTANITLKNADDPAPETVEITVEGAEGQAVTFKKASDDSVVATGVVGEAISVPTADKVYVVADDAAYYACASKGGVPYAKAFKPTSVDNIKVYLAGPATWGSVLSSDDVAGIGQYISEAAGRALPAEDLVETSVQNDAAPYIRFDLGEDVYVLAEGQDDCGAMIYFPREDTPAASLTALFDALNADADLNEIISSISKDEFDQGYTGETPVDPVETIKATISATNYITFASYKGEKLTKAQVLAAIKAACPLEIDDASLDLAKGEVKTADGSVTYKFEKNNLPTSYQQPTVLYKVTVVGKGEQYVAANGKLSGLGNGEMAGLMAEKTIVADAPTVAVAADGTATFTGTKDTTYVPAVKVAEVPATDVIAIEAGDAVPVVANKYVQKGATLSVFNASVTNQNISFTLTVNGVKKALKFDDKGMLNTTVTFQDDEEDPSLLTIKYAVGVDIYVNDGATPVQTGCSVDKAYAVANPVDGSKLVVGTKDADGVLTLAAPTAAYDEIRGRYTVKSDDIDGDGAIHLYSAWTYATAGTGFSLGTELKADKSDFATGKGIDASASTYIKDGAQIFVKAEDNNTSLAVDETNGKGLTLGAVQQAPSTSKAGIWALTVKGNVATNGLKKTTSLATSPVTGTTKHDVSHASAKLPVVTEVTFTGVAQSALPADVKVTEILPTGVTGVVFSDAEIVEAARTDVKATVTVTKAFTAGQDIGKVIIKLSDGSSVEATLAAEAAKLTGAASDSVEIKAAGAGSKATYVGTVAIGEALAENDTFTIGETEYTIIAASGTEDTTNIKAATATADWFATKIAAAVGTPTGFDAASASGAAVTLTAAAVGVDSNPDASKALLTAALSGTTKVTITVAVTAGTDATPAVKADFTGLDLGAILYVADNNEALTTTSTSGGKAINVKVATGAWTLEVATATPTVIGNGTRNADTGVITFTAANGVSLGTVVAPGTDDEMNSAFGSGADTGYDYTAVRTAP